MTTIEIIAKHLNQQGFETETEDEMIHVHNRASVFIQDDDLVIYWEGGKPPNPKLIPGVICDYVDYREELGLDYDEPVPSYECYRLLADPDSLPWLADTLTKLLNATPSRA